MNSLMLRFANMLFQLHVHYTYGADTHTIQVIGTGNDPNTPP